MTAKTEPKVQPVCNTCDSDAVKADAWAVWDFERQQWDLETTFDAAFCKYCDGEASLRWQEVTEEESHID